MIDIVYKIKEKKVVPLMLQRFLLRGLVVEETFEQAFWFELLCHQTIRLIVYTHVCDTRVKITSPQQEVRAGILLLLLCVNDVINVVKL